MKKLYQEYFYLPKHGKIRDKVMIMRVAFTAVIMIACLVAMGITGYAYFSHNVTSGSNIIKAANFEIDVSITITENDSSAPVDVTKKNSASYTADLKAGKTYTVTLVESQNSTAKTGFCVVTATGCPDTFHSQQIGVDASVENDGYTEEVEFQLKVTKDTTVTFLSHWGTSSYYDAYDEKGEGDRLYITNADINENKVVMIIDGVSEEECDANLRTETATTNTDNTTAGHTDSTTGSNPTTEASDSTDTSSTGASE